MLDPTKKRYPISKGERRSLARQFSSAQFSRSVVSDSLCPHGNYSGKNTGVGCHALLQGIFPIQGSNPGLLHCRLILYQLSHKGSPVKVYDCKWYYCLHLLCCSKSGICYLLQSRFSSVAQSCLTLCDPMNRSTPGLPVHHQLPEFTHTHVH